ncbi:ABC transporter permease [Tepiditoga spiralis]|uniref:ABC transporter permease n=1 Tax=Tepiditoga spiralis TaxID=2108365 RepID=UPI001685138D|nr:ABC-2 family transporter protein [Tepiditoga spiralis]
MIIFKGLSISKKVFLKDKTYLLNHIINNFGSFIFGYIYVSIWKSLTKSSEMTTYVMVNQSALWLTMFLPYGCYIPQKMREGTIAFELLKPYGIMYGSFFEVFGHTIYNFLFRSIPIYTFSILLLHAELPSSNRIIPYFITLFNAFLVAFFLNYFIGLWSMKFISYTGAQGLYYFFMNIFGGYFLPAEYFPGILKQIVPFLPFACTSYIPGSVYLGKISFSFAFFIQSFWIITLGITAYILTEKLSKNLKIQGG